MKTHFCPEERTMIDFVGECNWCGKKEEKEWQGLSDDDLFYLACEYKGTLVGLIRSVESKLKEKNT